MAAPTIVTVVEYVCLTPVFSAFIAVAPHTVADISASPILAAPRATAYIRARLSGTICGGRITVVVTTVTDIERVIGGVKAGDEPVSAYGHPFIA